MTSFRTLTVLAAVALAPAALHAQTDSIVYGRATITLAPAFVQQLGSIGATVTDLSQAPLVNGAEVFTALEGAIDLQTSFNEVIYQGGYLVSINGSTIRVQDLALELTATGAVFSGLFIENGTFVGRQNIFNISQQGGPAPSLPLVPENGTISHNGLSLSLAPAFISAINSAVGQSALNANTVIGGLDLYSVLLPTAAAAGQSTTSVKGR